MTEKDICNNIVTALNFQGYCVWRVNTGAMKVDSRFIRFNAVGTSDIIGMQKSTGKFVAIEVKKPGKEKTLTPAQLSFLEMVKLNGGIAFVATSVDDALNKL